MRRRPWRLAAWHEPPVSSSAATPSPWPPRQTPALPLSATESKMQGRDQNVFAKPESAMYTSGCQTGLISSRLTWRRRGALPLRQAHDIVRPADGGVSHAPAQRKPRLLEDVRQALRSRRSWHVGGRLPPFVRCPFAGGRLQYSDGAGDNRLMLRDSGRPRPRIRGRLIRHSKPDWGCWADRPRHYWADRRTVNRAFVHPAEYAKSRPKGDAEAPGAGVTVSAASPIKAGGRRHVG
jgi:hypothetical protein